MIYKMKNVIQDYAWGSSSAIPELLEYENKDRIPQAELWMGAHQRGTSRLIGEKGNISLSEYINENKEEILGEHISSLYGDLPFLFKVLAAGSPLSIQVHPDKKQAEEGFRKENERSVPLDAFNRNYKDDNHKPEIICALTPFGAMCGFRTYEKILANFQKVDLNIFRKEVKRFSHNRTPEGLESFFNEIMSLDGEKKNLFINELVSKSENIKEDVFEWVLKLYGKYPEDAAIAAPLYLNLLLLQPGQALYLSAGELHAYLDGMGMELMASSDNVLRGGLTPKYIDRDELKKILKFSGVDPNILEARKIKEGESTYFTPSEEFELTRIDLDKDSDYFIEKNNKVQILFAVEGHVLFSSEKEKDLLLNKGESVFIPFNAGKWRLKGEAILYRAAVPGEMDK